MKKSIFANYLIDHNASTIKAIKKINTLKGSSLIVAKNKKFLVGILSHRDLRKAIELNTITNKTIKKIYNPKPLFAYSDQLEKDSKKLNEKIQKLNIIPVINRKTKKITDILTKNKLRVFNIKKEKKLSLSVIIMAGGKGLRLMPYTSVLPKPLLPINSKPTIQHILDKFLKYSPKNIFVTMNYKSVILNSYLNEIKKSLKKNLILPVKENRPLGTFGSLFSIKNKLSEDFFLTNCDTIINLDYEELYSYHKKNNNDITIVTAIKKTVIPYGVCKIKNNNFEMQEKPKFIYNANTGFYIIKRNCLNILKKLSYMDFNDFLVICQKQGKKIGLYKIKEKNWIDIGQMGSYRENLNKKV